MTNFWRNNKRKFAMTGGLTLLVLVFVFSYLAFGQHREWETIKHVSVVFRHGSRTPTSSYFKDPHKNHPWPEGKGALTNEGKRQMYKLGKILRHRYANFISKSYYTEEMYVTSSDVDRCIMSAQVLLAAFYPPTGDQMWNPELPWQPVPVHTVPRNLDQLINVQKPCPRYKLELDKTENSDYVISVNEENRELYEYLAKHSGFPVVELKKLETLYDILESEKNNNLTLPEWTKPVFNDRMKALAALRLSILAFTPVMKRLKGGPLVKDIVEHMSRLVTDGHGSDRLMYLYSGHDVTLVSLYRALGYEELLKPDPGAALIFELHQPYGKTEFTVQLHYLNNTETSPPKRLEIPGCKQPCNLEKFKEVTKPFVPEDWDAECQNV